MYALFDGTHGGIELSVSGEFRSQGNSSFPFSLFRFRYV
jgi:hypothetical protein